MEPELCPPWWPSLIWWLLHHHPRHPEPPEEWIKRVRDPLEEIMVGVATYVQAEAFFGAKQSELREQLQRGAIAQVMEAAKQLAHE